MRRVDFQVNGLSVDTLVGTGNSRRLILDFSLDIYKIGESSIGDVVELGPFSAARSSRRAVGVVVGLVVGLGARLVVYDVDELKDQRSSSHDATASRQKVAADDVLEDGRFSGGLGSHDDLSGGALAASGETRIGDFAATHNLREIERVAADGVEHQVLQLVDRGEQIFAEGGHCSGVLGAFLVFFFALVSIWMRRSQTTRLDEVTGMIQQH